MQRSAFLANGTRALVVIDPNTESRLATTCFRGKEVRNAGNFFLWSNITSFFNDAFVMQELMKEIEEDQSEGSRSVTLEDHEDVGWSGTDKRSHYDDSVLEPFTPNKRSTALRVKTGMALAPRTKDITIIFSVYSGTNMKVVVHSIYPGPDIGTLQGDITEIEGVVFLGWECPGA